MKSIVKYAAAVLGLCSMSFSAFAVGVPNTVPEPGTLALVGLAVAGVVAFSRKRK